MALAGSTWFGSVDETLITANFRVAAAIDQVDIEIAVLREVRVECEAEQALFAAECDLARYIEKWRVEDRMGGKIEDLDQSALLHDEQPSRVAGR